MILVNTTTFTIFTISSLTITIISPTGQANKWIVSMEKENNLLVVKQTDPTFLQVVEEALQKGFPLLIEGIGETLDPVLGGWWVVVGLWRAGSSLWCRLGVLGGRGCLCCGRCLSLSFFFYRTFFSLSERLSV